MHKPAPLSTLRSDVPADVDRVIMKALEIDPKNRPATTAEWMTNSKPPPKMSKTTKKPANRGS